MPRKPRIEYAGACYHVMCRGNRREDIFWDDKDRELFLKTLGEACERTGWVIHAYVLMSNHYHLLLETPEGNLIAGMQWFQGTYTQRFNTRHKLAGHLFQGRYKAPIMDPEEPDYINRVSTYIHLNPVRAKLCCQRDLKLERYRWSSYRYYLKPKRQRPEWLSVNRVLESFHIRSDSPSGRARYRDHMRDRIRSERDPVKRKELDRQRKEIRRGWCLGSEQFREKMLERLGTVLGKGQKDSYSGWAKKAHDEQEAKKLLAKGMKRVGLNANALEAARKTDERKQVLAWLVRRNTVVSNSWVTGQLKMGHEVNVSQSVRRVEEAKGGRLRQLRLQAVKILRSKD